MNEMRHIGTKSIGESILVNTSPVSPQNPGDTWENRAKFEIIGIGPNFYGTVAHDILEFEEGRLRALVTIGDWSEGTYLIRASWLDMDGWVNEESLLTVTHPETDDPREGPDTALAPFLKEAFVSGHIPYEEESIPFTFEVEGGELIIRPTSALAPNHTYTVYIGPEAVLSGGKALGAWVQTTFDTKVSPLYVGRSEIMRELGVLARDLDERKLLSAIRLAGLKAHQLQRLSTNIYDVSSFEAIEEDADNYYATTRFVLYETLVRCAEGLFADMVYGSSDSIFTSGSYAIGDLQIQGSRDDGAGMAEQAKNLLNRRLQGWESELLYWRDAMMRRNARGYARAQNAAYRSGAGNAEDRTI
ncbi:hypothetical protein C0431_13240 [bacterium]|nr:hypothetical protein [bacterium]